MKMLATFLVITNILTAALLLHAREQQHILSRIVELWKGREKERVDLLNALLPFYLVEKAKVRDLEKIFKDNGLESFRKDSDLISGMLTITLDEQGIARAIKAEPYSDKTL